MHRSVVLALLFLTLVGCTAHRNLESGARVPTPAEWEAYCARNAGRIECP